jgi:hypothetical protein
MRRSGRTTAWRRAGRCNTCSRRRPDAARDGPDVLPDLRLTPQFQKLSRSDPTPAGGFVCCLRSVLSSRSDYLLADSRTRRRGPSPCRCSVHQGGAARGLAALGDRGRCFQGRWAGRCRILIGLICQNRLLGHTRRSAQSSGGWRRSLDRIWDRQRLLTSQIRLLTGEERETSEGPDAGRFAPTRHCPNSSQYIGI